MTPVLGGEPCARGRGGYDLSATDRGTVTSRGAVQKQAANIRSMKRMPPNLVWLSENETTILVMQKTGAVGSFAASGSEFGSQVERSQPSRNEEWATPCLGAKCAIRTRAKLTSRPAVPSTSC